MARLIDADLLKSKFDYNDNDPIQCVWKPQGVLNIIDSCPTADVAQVVHAKWIVDRYCSNCEFDNRSTCCETTKYCPDCGAKMDKE